MTSVTFETATLADAIKKAAVVAPTKGAAFDKSSGIVFDIDPNESEPVAIRATNLDIFYTEVVDAIKAEGEPVTWRFPNLLATAIGTFPIGSGKEVKMEQKGDAVYLTSGRIKAKLKLLKNEYYPSWEPFDPTTLDDVAGLGERIKMVAWAASTKVNDEPLSGIHFDGEYVVATDKYRIARADCPMPLAVEQSFTIPATIVQQVVKQMADTQIGIGGDMVLLMPDPHTQIKVRMFGVDYINWKRPTSREMPESLKVKKEAFLELIARCGAYIGTERFPTLRLFIGEEEIAGVLNNVEVGNMGDVIEVPGYARHPRVEIRVTPKSLSDALNACPNSEIELFYHTNPKQCMFIIDGGSGFRAWVAPRREGSTGE